MAIIIGKIKCWFCEKKGGVIHSTHDYGIYGEVGKRVFYHPECLEMVETNPERFGHNWADKALKIGELLVQNKGDYNIHLVDEFEKKVAKLHQHHFERMMPKKR